MIRGKHWDDGWLTAYWGREELRGKKELIFGSPCKPDAGLLNIAFTHTPLLWGRDFLTELEERGYDVTTIQFSIKRKWKPNERPA